MRIDRRAYLAGPITHAENPHSWRTVAWAHMPKGWYSVNPLDVEAKTKSNAEIVALDYCWILGSSAVIAKVDEPSWGTAMEIQFAHANRIPVVAFGNVKVRSPWLSHHITLLVPTVHDALDWLRRME